MRYHQRRVETVQLLALLPPRRQDDSRQPGLADSISAGKKTASASQQNVRGYHIHRRSGRDRVKLSLQEFEV